MISRLNEIEKLDRTTSQNLIFRKFLKTVETSNPFERYFNFQNQLLSIIGCSKIHLHRFSKVFFTFVNTRSFQIKFRRTVFEHLMFWKFVKTFWNFKINSKTYSDVHNSFLIILYSWQIMIFHFQTCFFLWIYVDFANFDFFFNSLHGSLYEPPRQWLG